MKILYYSGWTATRLISKLVFRIQVIGHEHFPPGGGCIVATNHLSYFDPLLAGSWSPRQMYFLAKKELFRNRLFGEIIRRTNALPVSRGTIDREALKLCFRVLKDGYGLLVFPEGTRSLTGSLLEPKLGVGMMARRAGCPIVPGYIHGSNRLKDCFLGRTGMSVSFGEPITTEWIMAHPADREGYRSISQEVMNRIDLLKNAAETLK
jgi:1-acyl-sn-glycerol-3-phosphate acyltransferase